MDEHFCPFTLKGPVKFEHHHCIGQEGDYCDDSCCEHAVVEATAARARLIAEAVKPYENCVAAAAPHYCATSCTDHNYPDCAKAWPECDILAARKALAAKD